MTSITFLGKMTNSFWLLLKAVICGSLRFHRKNSCPRMHLLNICSILIVARASMNRAGALRRALQSGSVIRKHPDTLGFSPNLVCA